MSTRKILTLASMIALSFAPAAFGADIADMATQFLRLGKHFQSIEYSSINGEKQDSGLGDLVSSYSAAEFQRPVVSAMGEKLDSGLGDLPADYTAAEFQKQVVAKR